MQHRAAVSLTLIMHWKPLRATKRPHLHHVEGVDDEGRNQRRAGGGREPLRHRQLRLPRPNPRRLLHSCILWLPLLLLVRWLGCVSSLCMPPHVAVTGLHGLLRRRCCLLLLAVATRGGAPMGLYVRPRSHARLLVVLDTAGRCRRDVYGWRCCERRAIEVL